MKYSRQGDMVEIIVRDAAGGKIESFRFSAADKKRHVLISKTLKIKYGICFVPEKSDGKKSRDLDWLNYDLG